MAGLLNETFLALCVLEVIGRKLGEKKETQAYRRLRIHRMTRLQLCVSKEQEVQVSEKDLLYSN